MSIDLAAVCATLSSGRYGVFHANMNRLGDRDERDLLEQTGCHRFFWSLLFTGCKEFSSADMPEIRVRAILDLDYNELVLDRARMGGDVDVGFEAVSLALGSNDGVADMEQNIEISGVALADLPNSATERKAVADAVQAALARDGFLRAQLRMFAARAVVANSANRRLLPFKDLVLKAASVVGPGAMTNKECIAALADIIDRPVSTVKKWALGQSEPRGDAQVRVRKLLNYVVNISPLSEADAKHWRQQRIADNQRRNSESHG